MKSRALIWGGIAVIVILVIAIVIWALYGARTTATPEPSPSSTASTPPPAPVPSAAPTIAPDAVSDDAPELLTPFVAAESALRSDPNTSLDLAAIATGDALDDLTVNARELVESGLVQVGAPKVITAEVTSLEADAIPPTATIRACLDYSAVDVQTADGTSVKDSSAPQQVPTTFTLVSTEGRWLVSERTFPDEPAC